MSRDSLDRATNASIRQAIANRLIQDLGQETAMPDRFQRLLEQLRLQEESGRRRG